MIPLSPLDAANQTLLDQVRPADWRSPTSSGVYDLVVIGAGTAGLVTAAGAAGLGAKVALIERQLMGGDCLNFGCVPSKALLRSAQVAAEARRAGEFGIRGVPSPEVDFPAVMERLRRLRAGLASNHSASRFAALGVDVYFGAGKFVGSREVEMDGSRLRFRRAVIATGARATMPQIPGLADADPLTNETVFNLTHLPPRLAVLGGGPVGCELAQAMARLGSKVTLIHRGPRVLERDDPDAAMVVQQALARDGVALRLGSEVARITAAQGARRLQVGGEEIEVDALLVATGRAPNVEGLALNSVGVEVEALRGVRVDDFLRTTHPRIFACGDVCLATRFTHAADAAARLVIQNALFAVGPVGRRRWSAVSMAWCTYTDPEIAHTGWTLDEARRRGLAVDTYTQRFEHIDRAITDSDTEGFVRVHTRTGTDRIVGATVVGRGAGDLISELSVAMAAGMGLGKLASVIHPYPTRAEAIRKCGDQFRRRRLTPFASKVLAGLLRVSRLG